MKHPTLKSEIKLWKNGLLVCGVDEVGRGSFAGPLVAAGVILKPNLSVKELSHLLSLGINDSKLVSIKKRKEIIKIAQDYIFKLSIQYISVDIINKKGIGFANKLAFEKVARKLLSLHANIHFLTDYFPIPDFSKSMQTNIKHGDQLSISIALASVIAKVNRDTFMENLANEIPEYGFERNKGYGTELHRSLIRKYGLSEFHRKSFCENYCGRIG